MRKIIFTTAFIPFAFLQIAAQQRIDRPQWDRPVQLKTCSIAIKADLFTATTVMEMEFYNPGSQQVEGLYQFELSPGQVITGFQLELNGKYRDGSIEERRKARNTYNTIVGKRIDPALLQMSYQDHYSVNIYPIAAKASRKIIITLEQILQEKNGSVIYSLPMKVRDTVKELSLNIDVRTHSGIRVEKGLLSAGFFESSYQSQKLAWLKKNVLLNQPIEFSQFLPKNPVFYSLPYTKVPGQNHFAFYYRPSGFLEQQVHPKEINVFWDASGALKNRDIPKEIDFLKQFIRLHKIQRINLITFNHKLLDTVVFLAGNKQISQLDRYLKHIVYTGATQLGLIDATAFKAELSLIFTDGVQSFGKRDPKLDRALVFLIQSRFGHPSPHLVAMVAQSGGGIISLNVTPMADALTRAGKDKIRLETIRANHGSLTIDQQLPIKENSTLFFTGACQPDADTLYLAYGNIRGRQHVEKLTLDSSIPLRDSSFNRLQMFNKLKTSSSNFSWDDWIDYGLKEKIVTSNTSFIVLERAVDYVKYNITPPADLKEECEGLNFVKRDTRFERWKIEKETELEMLNQIVGLYNQRIEDWDKNALPICLDPAELDKIQVREAIGEAAANLNAIGANQEQNLQGSLPGVVQYLSEVVVSGYGLMTKRSLTSSVTTLRQSNIFSGMSSVEQVLQGRVSGLEVINIQGTPEAAGSIRIRGINAVTGNNEPLFIVDNLPVAGNINERVNVDDIESITVMRDPSSTAIYGSRAVNGVIVITTKKGRRNYSRTGPDRTLLSEMEDIDYMQELKATPIREKLKVYERLEKEYGKESGFYIDAARHLYENGYQKEALEIIINAAEVDNGRLSTMRAIAFIFEGWKEFDRAISIYRDLILQEPNTVSNYRNLAWACFQNGNYQEAVDQLYSGIKVRSDYYYDRNRTLKTMMLTEMNSILAIHPELNTSKIPKTIIRPLPVQLRITVESNLGEDPGIIVLEPGDRKSKLPGTQNLNRYGAAWQYYLSPAEYQIKTAKAGDYKIAVHSYVYYYPDRWTTNMIRVMKFKNFGSKNQSIQIENVMMENQSGLVEIDKVSWK